jgi:ribonuclease R
MGGRKKSQRRMLNKSATLNKKKLKNAILSVLYEDPVKNINYKQISSWLGIRDTNSRRLVNISLQELAEDDYLEQVSRGRFRLKSKRSSVCGIVEMQPQGFAYIMSSEVDRPVVVSSRNLNHAMEGDKVRVSLFAHRRKHDLEGEVTQIIERAKTHFVGTVEMSRNFAFLLTSGKVGFDIFIPKENLKGAKEGQKAIAEIIEWPSRGQNPVGQITEILGDTGNNNAEMHAILAEFDLPYKFSENVNRAAGKIHSESDAGELKSRRDYREVTTFTIDPEDAKDFDDALSYRKLENGNHEVGVHIADVTHYVLPGSVLDTEAQRRGTSVYLVDRVVPMLPERLSNEICSLRPNEDRLCFSAVFELDDSAQIIKEWFGKTVISSDHRFTYEDAQDVIEKGEGKFSGELAELNEIAKILREERFRNGSIAFDRVEIKFNLGEKGEPLSVYFKEAKDSNILIEEFMLLANKRVASFIGDKKGNKRTKTFVYRIHDKPDPDKLESFNSFIHRFGYGIKLNSAKDISNSLNNLLQNVKGRKEQNVVESLAVRSMAKAEYSTRNIGHYGLSFDFYTHFTSPIRRYPDMMVHRLLEKYLNGGRSVRGNKYEDLCRHSSSMEERAANAERASVKYKQVEFMQKHLGELYAGVISGVTDWGIYVELENKIEGMIPVRELDDDFYIFDEKQYALRGRHKNKVYQLGDEIKVKIWRTNLERKQLDLRLAGDENN